MNFLFFSGAIESGLCLILGACLIALPALAAGVSTSLPGSVDKTQSRRPAQPINDTGMLQCVVNNRFTLACSGTGQDGEWGRDVSRSTPKDGHAGFAFLKVCHSGALAGSGSCPVNPALGNGPDAWGCTQDKVTGLIWEVKTADGGLRNWDRAYTNFGDGGQGDASELVAQVNAQGLCGATDWTLPTVRELQSLVQHGVADPGPTIDLKWFPNTAGGDNNSMYWTRDGSMIDTSHAWLIKFNRGEAVVSNPRYYKNRVRLVRAATAPSDKRFVPSPSGDEVTDTSTGLIWRRCVEGLAWTGFSCVGQVLSHNWAEALARAASQAELSGLAWRLPNRNELSSLIDLHRLNPAIDTRAFPGTPATWTWSSTPMAGLSNYAWNIDFSDGYATYHDRNGYHLPVRLVRDGP